MIGRFHRPRSPEKTIRRDPAHARSRSTVADPSMGPAGRNTAAAPPRDVGGPHGLMARRAVVSCPTRNPLENHENPLTRSPHQFHLKIDRGTHSLDLHREKRMLKRMLTPTLLAAIVAVACTEDAALTDPLATDPDLGFVGAGDAAERMYEITLENLTTSQPFSPGVVVTHARKQRLFMPGAPASEGIRVIAENGDPSVSVVELTGAPGIFDVQATTAPVGRADDENIPHTLTVQVKARGKARFLSLAVMLICTNDGFTGLNTVPLPRGFHPRSYYAGGYDAGTEENDELFTSIVDACGAIGPVPVGPDGQNNRTATEGVIAHHPNIAGTGDLSPRAHGWEGPVLKVTVRRIPTPVEYEVTLENLTTSQPMSPGVVVTHAPDFRLFRRHGKASEGLRAIAENGDPSVAVDELTGAPGVYQVVATTAPLGRADDDNIPSTLTVRITGTRRANRLSVATMLICTNDGFAGVRSARLPRGYEARTFYGFALDAGTEENDELYTSIVDACGAIGPVAVPADGENNRTPTHERITRHRNIQGVGDLSKEFHTWGDRVMKITVRKMRP